MMDCRRCPVAAICSPVRAARSSCWRLARNCFDKGNLEKSGCWSSRSQRNQDGMLYSPVAEYRESVLWHTGRCFPVLVGAVNSLGPVAKESVAEVAGVSADPTG